MQSQRKGISDRTTTAKALRRAVLATTMLDIGGTLVAACGGGSPKGGVPSLGTHTSGNPTAGSSAARLERRRRRRPGQPGDRVLRLHALAWGRELPRSRHPPQRRRHQRADGGARRDIQERPGFRVRPAGLPQAAPERGEPTHQTVTPLEQTQYLKAAACIRSQASQLPRPDVRRGWGAYRPSGARLELARVQIRRRRLQVADPGGVKHPGVSSSHSSSVEAAP